MASRPGIFIVLEGADGSGKSTQFDVLHDHLRRQGREVEVFKFPQYDKSSSYFVKRYLNGEYGPASQINPYNATLFYALDRFEAGPAIRKALSEGKIVLSDRYVGSNMAHQGAKFAEGVDKRAFFVWEDSLEYQVLGIPKPDINLFLRVPAEISYQLIGKKSARSYTNKSHDEHEKDINHLSNAVKTYDLLCQLFPDDFKAIECVKDGELLSVEAISQKVWQTLKPLLPEADEANEPAPKPAQSPPAVAEGSSAELVWQIDKISLLAAIELKKQFTHLELNPAKDNYYVPNFVSKKLRRDFEAELKHLISGHKKLQSKLAKLLPKNEAALLARLAQPLASASSARLKLDQASAQPAVDSLTGARNTEVMTLGLELKKLVDKKWPHGLPEGPSSERTSSPEAISDIIAKLTSDTLNQNQLADEPVRLIEALPRNEFDLIAESLYPHSDLSLPQLAAQLENWDYSQKLKALKSALSSPRPAVLERANYRFDMLTDHETLLRLLQLGVVGNVQAQAGSPRHGYDVPENLEELNLLDAFQEMFDRSLEFYSRVQSAGEEPLADYACLAGHRLRWQGTFSGQDIASLASQTDKLAEQLIEAIKSTHPLVAERLVTPKKPPTVKKPNAKPKARPRRGKTSPRPKKP
ncbi:MAG TPA: thymidylate kinase [Candidatus Saccharimonadales bacterium]|nr:thymidylate kinase [Candidatus Saccharimonadales bacterium]